MTPTQGHFRITRSYPAPPAALWHLLTDPEARTEWGAPSDDHVLVLDAHDLREGGRDRHCCGPADAPEYIVDTHWYHRAGPEAACFTETLVAGGQRLSVSLVSYGLSDTGAGTDLVVDVTVASLAGEDITKDHEEGWTSALGRLARIAEAADA